MLGTILDNKVSEKSGNQKVSIIHVVSLYQYVFVNKNQLTLGFSWVLTLKKL